MTEAKRRSERSRGGEEAPGTAAAEVAAGAGGAGRDGEAALPADAAVLSGEKPVTDAIAEARMSRGTYYQLEERALEAMLAALGPTPPGRKTDQGAELAALQAKLTRLEQEKRRSERLLLLTRKVMKPGRLTLPGLGRPRSTKAGSRPSRSSSPTSPSSGSLSTPTQGGAGGA